MKRLLQIILAITAALLLFSSCERKKVIPGNSVSLSSTGETVNSDGQKAGFTIVSKVDWILSTDNDWITPDVTGGSAGNTAVVLTIGANNGANSRKGTVTVSAQGERDPYLFTVTQSGLNVLTGANKWIYETLGGWYYWNDAVKAASPPANSLAYDDFLETLLLNLDGAKDTDTNPATIDGGYDTYSNGSKVRYVYSYITRTAATRAAGEETTFGFDIKPFYLGRYDDDRLGFLVKWVQPGGPADEAGIKRGTWIYKYAGKTIYEPDYEKFWYQLHYLQGGTAMSLTDEDGNEFSLTATDMKVSPIIYPAANDDIVITSPGGKKVAYLVYNQFEGGEGGEFNEELRTIFGEFKAAGATELVLDLRYNPGGYISSCQILTSLAANVRSSGIFAKLLRNKNIKAVENVANPQTLYFRDESKSLGLNRIYVLETENSASASEMVINALRGAGIDVVHIGTNTEGKNVGMDLCEKTVGGYGYEMWPITFKIMNANNFCDYAGGFTPDHAKNEFWEVDGRNPDGSGIIYELGDPREHLLSAALTLIDGGTVAPDAATRAGESERLVPELPRDPRRGGAKYIPDPHE